MSVRVVYIINMSDGILRRAELAERQAFVAALLAETQTDQLLVFEPPNLSWFAGAPLARGILNPAEQPVLVISATQHWVVCSNNDSQRIFDTFVDELGFQLKEWPWHMGRDQLLADLCDKKKLCCDRNVRDAVSVAERLQQSRLTHSPRCQQALRDLGRDVAHALEATGRAAEIGNPERELAGQVAHRLAHRGIEAISIHAAGDDRDANDSRPAFTDRPCQRSCIISAIGRRDGLHVSASRTIWFGDDEEVGTKQREIAGQITAARGAALQSGVAVSAIFNAGQRVAEALNQEHAWRDGPFGYWTGWLPIETLLSPIGGELLATGQAITLSTRLGMASYLDTYLITDAGSERITSDAEGPIRRYRIAGQIIELPNGLRR